MLIDESKLALRTAPRYPYSVRRTNRAQRQEDYLYDVRRTARAFFIKFLKGYLWYIQW